MGIPYTAFDFKRIVAAALLCGLVFWAGFARAQDNPLFVVEGITVDVTEQSAVAAQQKAFEQAQVKAFEALAARMVKEGGAKSAKTPDVLTISAMIKDFEVTNEQASAVRYVGTYTFRFRESDVENYFAVSGVRYTDVSSQALMVLPVLQKTGAQASLWAEGNLWLQAWSRATLPAGAQPIEVPIGDLMDVGDVNDTQVMSPDMRRLTEMQARYGASESVLMLAVADAALSKVPGDADKAFGMLEISFYRMDLGAPQFVQEIHVMADKTENRTQLYDRAVLQAYRLLQSDWKATVTPPGGQAKGYDARVRFSGLKDWVRVQRLLRAVPGMNDLDIGSVSPREARLRLNFRGDEAALREALAQAGMALGEGIPDGAGVPFYELQADVAPRADDFYAAPGQDEGGNASAPRKTGYDFYSGPEAPENQEPGAGGDDMVQTF